MTHAVRFDGKGGVDDLGSLGGNAARASAINDAGLIVGSASIDANYTMHAFVADGTPRALLYEGGRLIDLNSLTDLPRRLVLLFATGIDDQGEIVAYNSQGFTVLLRPE